jgi:hypothetical protein
MKRYIFVTLYILTLPFTAIWQLPYLGQKFQLPELIFLLAVVHVILNKKILWEGTKIDWLLLVLPLAYSLAAIIHPGKAAILEVLGLCYLYGVYYLTKDAARQTKTVLMERAVDYLSISLIIISICTFVLSVWGVVEYGYLAERKWLPFIGWVTRISGFAVTPNMWASTLFFAVFLQLGIWKANHQDKFRLYIILGLIVAASLTFSKSLIVALGVGMFVFTGRWWIKVGGVVLVGIYLALCHWIIIPNAQIDAPASYFSAKDCYAVGNYEICATTYWQLKKTALQAFRDTDGMGVGGGQFIDYVAAQQRAGKYPSDMLTYDPHSTYFGLLAEAGIFGITALLLLLFFLSKDLSWRKLKQGGKAGVLAYLCLIGIEALVMDVLNFRMLWVALGMMAASLSQSTSEA